ncbi:MAG: T9SS type A sorting domain-containing protein [Cyclonatronaceae bacterium]
MSASVINELITNGKKVWLLYTAATPLGGQWASSTADNNRDLQVEQSQIFPGGYHSDLSFTVQKSGVAYSITSDYPAGWSILAHNAAGDSCKTVMSSEHGSGGKGLIYTYNPDNTSETGKNVFDMMYDWLEGVPADEGKTVPEGHVALVISRYDDSANPDLTTEETALYSKLSGFGYNVSFIRFSRLLHSDLSGAMMVAAATYPSIDAISIGEYLSSGKNVLLLHTAASPLGGQWASSTMGGARNLFVASNQNFLNAYEAEDIITVQSTGTAFAITSDYPSGWDVLGRNTQSTDGMTAFSYNGVESKGAILTYDPASFSTEGDDMLADIVEWLLPEPTSASPQVAELPDAFELNQNYPNPFNPATTISYALPVDANVTLEIFNIQGQRVDILVNQWQEAGYHDIPFDASRLASGLYIYRLQAGIFVNIKKMMLLK